VNPYAAINGDDHSRAIDSRPVRSMALNLT
jgi:hypothetical protein